MDRVTGGSRDHVGPAGRFMREAGAELAQAVRSAAHVRRFGQGADLPAAGPSHPGGPIMVIHDGYAGIAAVAEDGRRTLLAIRGPGDLVGEQALFRGPGMKYGLSVRSLTDVSAWPVPQHQFRRILERHPQGWAVLAKVLQDRLDAAEERITLMASASASQRLAVFILQLLSLRSPAGTRYSQAAEVPLTQAELGEWIGASRETVERVISRWVQRGAVHARRRYLLILDIAYLERIAGVSRPALPRTA